MNDEELAELAARRERYAADIQEFCEVCVAEYARAVTWMWTSSDPEDFEAKVRMELHDGSTRSIPLYYEDNEYYQAMAIRCGDAGFRDLDAAGLYSYLWNHDATELRKAREALAKAREYAEKLHFYDLEGVTMKLLARLARALYDLESGECALKFHEQTADVRNACLDMAWGAAMGEKGAGDVNPVSAGAADGPRP